MLRMVLHDLALTVVVLEMAFVIPFTYGLVTHPRREVFLQNVGKHCFLFAPR